MIWRLARQQSRANRGYFAWATAMLAVAVAFVGFAGFQAHTRQLADSQANELAGFTYERNAWLSPWIDGSELPVSYSGAMLEADARQLVDRAQASDVPFSARRYGTPFAVTTGEPLVAASVIGDHAYALLGVDRLPASGEVVLSAAAARKLHAGVGDVVSLAGRLTTWEANAPHPDEAAREGTTHDFTVIQIMKTPEPYAYGYGTDALLSWDDSFGTDSVFTDLWIAPDHGISERLETASIHLSWDGGSPALDALAFEDVSGNDIQSENPASSWVAWMGAVAMAASVILMAFALGRTQAQRRLQWVATARTLGAEKGTLRAVAALEALGMAGLAFVLGVAGAALANITYVSIHNFRAPRGIVPLGLGSAAWVWSVAAVLAIVLSVIVAIVPAYWASRVPPVAALKSVNEVTEAEASRRVSVWWLVIPLALAISVPFVTAGWQPTLSDGARVVATIVDVILGFFLLLELFRVALPILGRWLTRRRAAWAIAAGIAVSARPRQYVAPAFVTMLAVMTAALLSASNLGNNAFKTVVTPDPLDYSDTGWNIESSYLVPSWVATTATLSVAIAVLVGLAIAVNNARVSERDDSTQRALGLSRRDSVRSAFVQFFAPQVAGVAVGSVIGGILALASPLQRAYDTQPAHDETGFLGAPSIVDTLAALGLGAGIALVIGAIGAAVFAATQSRRDAYPPIERGADNNRQGART